MIDVVDGFGKGQMFAELTPTLGFLGFNAL